MTQAEIKEGITKLEELSKRLDVLIAKTDKAVGMPKHVTKLEDKIKYMKDYEQI